VSNAATQLPAGRPPIADPREHWHCTEQALKDIWAAIAALRRVISIAWMQNPGAP
jgi:hypothetical protein